MTTTPDKATVELHSMGNWGTVLRIRSVKILVTKIFIVMALPETIDIVTRTMPLASESKLIPSIDANGQFPFTTEGVRDAFRLREPPRQGKLVITVAKE